MDHVQMYFLQQNYGFSIASHVNFLKTLHFHPWREFSRKRSNDILHSPLVATAVKTCDSGRFSLHEPKKRKKNVSSNEFEFSNLIPSMKPTWPHSLPWERIIKHASGGRCQFPMRSDTPFEVCQPALFPFRNMLIPTDFLRQIHKSFQIDALFKNPKQQWRIDHVYHIHGPSLKLTRPQANLTCATQCHTIDKHPP